MSLDSQQVEIIARNWLTTELVIAGFEVALPLRDNGVDLLVSPPDYPWTLAVQVKAHRDRKMRIESKYLGRNVAIAYVFLGEQTASLPVDSSGVYVNKGNDYSPRTLWMTPEEAWSAPSASGLRPRVRA